jgi:hypothetical protein
MGAYILTKSSFEITTGPGGCAKKKVVCVTIQNVPAAVSGSNLEE